MQRRLKRLLLARCVARVFLPTVTSLSLHNRAAAMGQMSPTWDSVSPFVIAEPHDWCVCVCERQRGAERERGQESECMQERAGENSLVREGVWGWFKERALLLGVIKIAIRAWKNHSLPHHICTELGKK